MTLKPGTVFAEVDDAERRHQTDLSKVGLKATSMMLSSSSASPNVVVKVMRTGASTPD